MLNADRALRMAACPRCGIGGYEKLKSHGHCVNCNYNDIPMSEEMLAIPDWAITLLKSLEVKKKKNKRESKSTLVLAIA